MTTPNPDHSVYVYLAEPDIKAETTRELGYDIHIDFDADGEPVGVEILDAHSVTIDGKPVVPPASTPDTREAAQTGQVAEFIWDYISGNWGTFEDVCRMVEGMHDAGLLHSPAVATDEAAIERAARALDPTAFVELPADDEETLERLRDAGESAKSSLDDLYIAVRELQIAAAERGQSYHLQAQSASGEERAQLLSSGHEAFDFNVFLKDILGRFAHLAPVELTDEEARSALWDARQEAAGIEVAGDE